MIPRRKASRPITGHPLFPAGAPLPKGPTPFQKLYSQLGTKCLNTRAYRRHLNTSVPNIAFFDKTVDTSDRLVPRCAGLANVSILVFS